MWDIGSENAAMQPAAGVLPVLNGRHRIKKKNKKPENA